MPGNSRWTLNPKKWFGMKLKVGQKQESNANPVARAPPPTATTSTIPRIFSAKNKVKVIPFSMPNDAPRNSRSTTQLQLPAFSVRRERTLTILQRQKTFHPTHTEPTIRKNSRIEDLSIDTTRWNIPTIPTSINGNFKQSSSNKHNPTSVSNTSHCCIVDYPQRSANRIEECSLPSRSSSRSSMIDSSSSGIFTDERQCTESKETSTLEVLSIESIADSQTSVNDFHARPIIHHYRKPMSVFELTEDKPQSPQTSLIRSHRSQSAEGTLRDNPFTSAPKSRQSSAAIIKKIEKRFRTSRSPSGTLEKAGFIRLNHDTYRLSTEELGQFPYSRRNSINSFESYSNYDDPLPPAHDQECYATLPRTSSTEQLNNNLRLIADECIRPMVTSLGKTRSTKTLHRYKRSHPQTQLNIENITQKLLSSIDDSMYTRYKRCN